MHNDCSPLAEACNSAAAAVEIGAAVDDDALLSALPAALDSSSVAMPAAARSVSMRVARP
jgi:hypothetical protein